MTDRASDCESKAVAGVRCPRCQGTIIRVRRRTLDRLINLVLTRHRYRCTAVGCGWEGRIRPLR
jgi:hypothetical protein